MYKVHNGMVPTSLTILLEKTIQVHGHQTRQARYDFLPHTVSRILIGAVPWNNLSSGLKSSEIIYIFNNRIKNFEICYCSCIYVTL